MSQAGVTASTTLIAWSSRQVPAWFARWVATLQEAPGVLWLDVDTPLGDHASSLQRSWWQAMSRAMQPGSAAHAGGVMVWQPKGEGGWMTLQGAHAWRWLMAWQEKLVRGQVMRAPAWGWNDIPGRLRGDEVPVTRADMQQRDAAEGPSAAPAGLTPLPARPSPSVQGLRPVPSWSEGLPMGSLPVSHIQGRTHPRNIYQRHAVEQTDGSVAIIAKGSVTRSSGGGDAEAPADNPEAPPPAADMPPPAADMPTHPSADAAAAALAPAHVAGGSAALGAGDTASLVSSLASSLLDAIRQQLAVPGALPSAAASTGTGAGAVVPGATPGPVQQKASVATFSIHVDSRDRNTALYPTPSYYKVNLKETIRKVRAVNLTSIVVPNTEQVIRANPVRIRNNRFYWTTRERYAVVLLPANPFMMTRDSRTVVVTDPSHGFPTLMPDNTPPTVCLSLPTAAGGLEPPLWFGPLPITVLDPNRYSVVLSLPSQFTGATGGMGVRRFQTMDNSYSVELDPGFYDPSSFKDQFLSKVNQVQRNDPMALVSDYHNFDMELDTNTNTVKLRSLAVSNLATPFAATYNSSIIRVNYPDHNLVPGDRVRITKTNPFGNIPTAKFNDTFTVLGSNFTAHQFEIDVGIKSNETNPAAGGTGVQISRLLWFSMSLDTNVVTDSFGPLIGFGSAYPRQFLQEHNNIGPDGAPLSPIQLSGENYILMQIPTFDKGLRQQSTSQANRAFAVLQLSLPPGSIIYNQFISPTCVFAPEPLDQLTELEVRMIKGNGDLFFFNNIDHSFTLEIMYEQFNK